MGTRIATESCHCKRFAQLTFAHLLSDTSQPMVANTKRYDYDSFVKRLNEALDDAEVIKGRGRRKGLAELMGMTGEAARKWLGGDTLPSMENACDFCLRTGVQVEWFLTGRGGKKAPVAVPQGAILSPEHERVIRLWDRALPSAKKLALFALESLEDDKASRSEPAILHLPETEPKNRP